MVTSDFVVVQAVTKVEWKSATITHGALCVMTPGAHLMQEWHADSLDFHQQVHVELHNLYMYADSLHAVRLLTIITLVIIKLCLLLIYIISEICMFAFLK